MPYNSEGDETEGGIGSSGGSTTLTETNAGGPAGKGRGAPRRQRGPYSRRVCVSCRILKKKCSGESPCFQCLVRLKKDHACVYAPPVSRESTRSEEPQPHLAEGSRTLCLEAMLSGPGGDGNFPTPFMMSTVQHQQQQDYTQQMHHQNLQEQQLPQHHQPPHHHQQQHLPLHQQQHQHLPLHQQQHQHQQQQHQHNFNFDSAPGYDGTNSGLHQSMAVQALTMNQGPDEQALASIGWDMGRMQTSAPMQQQQHGSPYIAPPSDYRAALMPVFKNNVAEYFGNMFDNENEFLNVLRRCEAAAASGAWLPPDEALCLDAFCAVGGYYAGQHALALQLASQVVATLFESGFQAPTVATMLSSLLMITFNSANDCGVSQRLSSMATDAVPSLPAEHATEGKVVEMFTKILKFFTANSAISADKHQGLGGLLLKAGDLMAADEMVHMIDSNTFDSYMIQWVLRYGLTGLTFLMKLNQVTEHRLFRKVSRLLDQVMSQSQPDKGEYLRLALGAPPTFLVDPNQADVQTTLDNDILFLDNVMRNFEQAVELIPALHPYFVSIHARVNFMTVTLTIFAYYWAAGRKEHTRSLAPSVLDLVMSCRLEMHNPGTLTYVALLVEYFFEQRDVRSLLRLQEGVLGCCEVAAYPDCRRQGLVEVIHQMIGSIENGTADML